MKLEAHLNGLPRDLAAEPETDVRELGPGAYSVMVDGRPLDVYLEHTADGVLEAFAGGRRYLVEIRDPRSYRAESNGAGAAAGGVVTAPMPGKVVALHVEPGQSVETGQGLLVVEAMKMQNEIRSPKAGAVADVRVAVGDSVTPGQPLILVE